MILVKPQSCAFVVNINYTYISRRIVTTSNPLTKLSGLFSRKTIKVHFPPKEITLLCISLNCAQNMDSYIVNGGMDWDSKCISSSHFTRVQIFLHAIVFEVICVLRWRRVSVTEVGYSLLSQNMVPYGNNTKLVNCEWHH